MPPSRLANCSAFAAIVIVAAPAELQFRQAHLVQLLGYDLVRAPSLVPRVLPAPRPPHRPELPTCSARRRHVAVHQRGHEPVQGRLPRPGTARVLARDDLAEVHAGQRQAQRSRQRRAFPAAPHVLRDARQLLVRRLLQARRHRAGLGAADHRVGDRERQAVCHDLQGRRRHPPRRRGVRAVAGLRAGRPDRRAWLGRQLLVDGRHRSVRSVLGDSLLSRKRPAVQCADMPRPGLRLRSVRRDLEQRLHGVRPAAWRPAAAPAQAVDRHGHGAGAHHRGPRRDAVQLRHRRVPLTADPHRSGGGALGQRPGPAGQQHGADGGLFTCRRRPPARHDVPHRRRRAAEQRVARLRPAEDHAARDAPRETPRVHRAVPPRPGKRAGRLHGRRVPRIACRARDGRPGDSGRRASLRVGAHQRAAEARRDTRARGAQRLGHQRRRRVSSLRHPGSAA